ncbi:MAG: right-handed parallel beta-helix repeat-containing protein, partial [Anaerolineae bacterium]|nr:right-handed parallel beta-helix repeat-containing protein [Anaerolineae bacterium]
MAVCLWLTGQPLALHAADVPIRYVAPPPAGSDTGNDCLNRFEPCATIQRAVSQASAGDEIRVAAGTYTGYVELGKRLTLRGGFTTSDWLTSDPVLNQTTIDAQNTNRVLAINSGIIATVSGFHITGGYLDGTGDLYSGAGVSNRGNLTLTECWIHGNRAVDSASLGGGVANRDGGTLTIRDSFIYSNTAGFAGGGVSARSNTTIEATEVYNNVANTAISGGGGIEVQGATLNARNVLVYNNSTVGNGGGLLVDGGTLVLDNGTFYANYASSAGGAMLVFTATATIKNTIIATNTAGYVGGILSSDSSIQVTYTDFWGNTPTPGSYTSGTGNRTDQAPLFVDAANGDLHLSAGSPAIDSGDATGAPSVDFEGHGRPFGSGIDRGADEYTAPSDCYARLAGGRVYTDVQTAVDAASSGGVVQVAGTCAGVQTRGGTDQVAYIDASLTLRGGYTVTNWTLPSHHTTILDAQDAGRVIYAANDTEIFVQIENLHIRNGTAANGGGVYLGPTVVASLYNNVIYDNAASNSGGGIYFAGTANVQHNVIYNNTAAFGGGAYADGTLTLGNSVVANNTASTGGGGVFVHTGEDFTFDYNNLYNNTPGHYGGDAVEGATDLHVAPQFADAAGGDFHLAFDSELVNRADPASTLSDDFEGDARPQGSRSDVGADERLTYTDVAIGDAPESPFVFTDPATIAGQVLTFTHTIVNLGYTDSPTDSFTLDSSNSEGWTVLWGGISSPVVLEAGESRTFEVLVTAPDPLVGGVYNETVITATSQSNPSTYDTAVDIITSPGVEFFPNYDRNADPGQVLTYTHTLRNTGGGEDTFRLDLTSPLGWGELVEPTPTLSTTTTAQAYVTLAPGEETTVVARTTVPNTAPARLADVMTIQATSGFSESFFDVVTDTTTVNPITGDRYVSTLGTNTNNNCTQPDHPCTTIGYAVNQAIWGDSVLVAQGTYNEVGIRIDSDIRLLGGYLYSGGAFSLPGGGVNPAATVINVGNSGRGIFVERTASSPEISGFTVVNAYISGHGGAFYLDGGSPTLSNVIIQSCTATRGGAIYVRAGAPVIEDVTITNVSAVDQGGAIYNEGGDPVLLDVSISDAAANRGGALYNEAGDMVGQALTLLNNDATTLGGGVYQLGGTVMISQTHVASNTAESGGGFYAAGGTLQVWNTVVYSNTATTGSGGGIYKGAGGLEIVNDTFYGNWANTFGGGLYDAASAPAVISNTIFAANAAVNSGGGLYRISTGALSIDYNDFWNNTASSSPNSNVATGLNSIAADPLFEDPAVGDFHLTYESPAVDAGDPATFLAADIDGDRRPINQGYDIGADELAGCLAWVVVGGTQVGPVYGTVQEAIDAAPPSAVVRISGVCRGVQSRLVSGQVFRQAAYVDKNLTLQGDLGTGPATSTLDALGEGRVLVVNGAVSVQVSRLVLLNGDASGLGDGPGNGDAGGGVYNDSDYLRIWQSVIADGSAGYGGGIYHANGTLALGSSSAANATTVSGNLATYGGGIYLAGGTIEYARVEGNLAQQGGGLYNGGSATVISQTLFLSNTATLGGGIYNGAGSLHADRLTVQNNDAIDGGGVCNVDDGELMLQRSVLISNTATGDGGGVYNTASGTASIINTILAANTAGGDGGGLYNLSAALTVRHDTFYANRATDQGGGIYHASASTAALINSSLIVTNTAASGAGIYSGGSDPAFDYNDVYGNLIGGNYGGTLAQSDGTGNIGLDPNFISTDPASADFLRLPAGSPAEEVADPNSPVTFDIEDDPRPTNQGFDIGADEVGGCYVRINGQAPTYGNVQNAVNDSSDGDTLYVAGVCMGVNTVQSMNQTVFLTKTLTVQGGYTTTNWSTPDPIANPTILDALGMGRVVYIADTAVVTMTGLHLRQGSGTNGGAVFVVSGGTFSLTESLVYSSTATNGGAFYNAGGRVYFDGNTVFGNQATGGGAFYNAGGQALLDSTVFHANHATTNGGAVYHGGGSTTLQNDVFWANSATSGGGVYNIGNNLIARHNTFYANSASNGGGLYTANASPGVVSNIFSNNTVSMLGHAVFSENTYSVDYNDVWPAAGAYNGAVTAGAHSLSVDPLLANPMAGDFHLLEASPVIDRGDPTMTLPHDFEDDLRPGDQGFDMGADEWRSCYAKIVRTGVIYGNIQSAIDASIAGDQILVTVGTCRNVHPYDYGGSTLYQTVHVDHNLTLRGGYDATFAKQCQGPLGYPDPICATTLDAMELGRVVVIANTAAITMERFNIVNGDAVMGGGDSGGGMFYEGTAASLAHVDFYSNTATYGGALYNGGSGGFTMFNTWAYYNTATDGGVLYNTGTLTITGEAEPTLMYNNTATGGGGAIYNAGGSVAMLDNVTIYDRNGDVLEFGGFKYNQAAQGGAVYNAGGSVYANNNEVEENVAGRGGAFYNESGTTTLEDNVVGANAAEVELVGGVGVGVGGGVYNQGGTLVLDLGNAFHHNAADVHGGAIAIVGGSATVWNTLIYSNTAADGGAGIYVGAGSPSILHNTLYQNLLTSDTGYGGGIYIATGATPTIKNTIFHSNYAAAAQGSAVYGSSGTLDYNDYFDNVVEGGVAGGTHSRTDDPQLAGPGAGDFHLLSTSPMINQAQDGLGVDHDFEGDPRPVNSGPDIGADETNDCLARVLSTGITYGRIQDAIDAAAAGGDTIWVAEGICEETLTINDNITIEGSWEKDFSEQVAFNGIPYVATIVAAPTGAGRVVYVDDLAGTVTLSWLRLADGVVASGNGGGLLSDASTLNLSNIEVFSNTAASGGGIYINTGTAQLDEVFANGNEALSGSGGGIYAAGGTAVDITGGEVWGNHASADGGGIYNASGSQVSVGGGAAIEYNEADGDGGGIYNAADVFTCEQKQLRYNHADGSGGGIYAVGGGTFELVNVNLYANTATVDGGGLYRDGTGTSAVLHSDIWENQAATGGGVYNTGGTLDIVASIVASNTATTGDGIYGAEAVNVNYTVRWNDVYVISGGSVDHEIEANPHFRNTSGDLLYTSPAIDAVPADVTGVTVDRVLD